MPWDPAGRIRALMAPRRSGRPRCPREGSDMLRRKLMLFLGSLLAMLLVMSIVSVYLLQGVLSQMDHAAGEDGAILQTANGMTDSITDIEIQLREIQLGHVRHLDSLLDRIDALKEQADLFG